MIPFKKARYIILRHATQRKVREVGIKRAFFKVLAQDIHGRFDEPAFARAVMDGFAVRSRDTERLPSVLKVMGTIPAGRVPQGTLKSGACVKIATGARVPRGADAVVKIEDVCLKGRAAIKISKTLKPYENIYRKAEDFKKGSLLLKQGSVINAAALALLYSQGFTTVKVFQPPSVAVLATGDEIAEPGSKKTGARIWNATSPMLLAALGKMGLAPHYLGIAQDHPVLLLKKIKEGLKYDILVISGAVSAGERDLVPAILRKAGARLVFHKIALKPGKPFLFARRANRLIFGLPGNPVSSLVAFSLLVRPAIRKILGFKDTFVLEEGVLKNDAANDSGRMALAPARIVFKKGVFEVYPLRYCGSADLLAVSRADGYLIQEAEQKIMRKDSAVRFIRSKEW